MSRAVVGGLIEVSFDPNGVLFHGTLDIYVELLRKHGIKIIRRSKGGVDFGPGFYLSVRKKEQAVVWAETNAGKVPPPPNQEILEMLGMTVKDFFNVRSRIRPSIVKYRIKDPESWMRLRHIIFNNNSMKWQKHVWLLRGHLRTGGLFIRMPAHCPKG